MLFSDVTLKVMLGIFYYDYVITVGDEYWYIWNRPKHVGSYLFFLNRYITFLGVCLRDEALETSLHHLSCAHTVSALI